MLSNAQNVAMEEKLLRNVGIKKRASARFFSLKQTYSMGSSSSSTRRFASLPEAVELEAMG